MNDAKSCYDRVVHSAAILTMRSFGVPAPAARVMMATLQQAKHYIKTGFERSGATYGNEQTPIQGTGQGNGAAPALWALISTKIIRMMERAGHGVHLLTSITAVAISIVCFAFVDDTDTVHSGKTVQTSGEEVMEQFQEAVDRWEGGLTATGGAIEPTKTFWYLIDFQWDGSRYQYRTMDDMPGEISIKDCNRQRVTLQRHDVSHAEKTLGVYVAMDGNQAAEKEYLLAKSMEFRNQLCCQRVAKNDVLYTYRSSFLKSLE